MTSMALAPARRREREYAGWLQGFLRWTYARWLQVLAHGDLLGPDGRPSQGKMAAFTAMVYGFYAHSDVVVIIALAAAWGRTTLIKALAVWRGVSISERVEQVVTLRDERLPSKKDDESFDG